MDESERYLWHLDVFYVLIILTLLGGVSTIPEFTGGRGHPSSQMQRIMHIIEIMFKIHFSRFWPYYLLF